MESRERSVIVALDDLDEAHEKFKELEDVRRFAQELSGRVWGFKVHQLIDRFGPPVITLLKQFGKVFADMKIHEVPSVTRGRVKEYADHGADLITIHALAGKGALQEAYKAGKERVVAVTELTSNEDSSQVLPRAALAYSVGIRNIVCSVHEARAVREIAPDARIITPGIRGPNDPKNDQSRTATADEAFAAGADLLVVGRPITSASDPVAALKRLLGIKD